MNILHSFWSGGNSWRQRHGEPKNRRQLFLCVLFDQFFSFPSINLLYALFWLPTILWTVTALLRLSAAMELGEDQEALAYLNGFFLGLIPCIALTGPVKAGMALVMRNWARESYTGAFRTFWKGFRGNWRPALCVSFVSGLFPAILWYGFLIALRSGNRWMPPLLILTLAVYGFFLLTQQVLYTLLVTYDLPLLAQLKNAWILTLLRLPAAIMVFMGSLFFVLLYGAFAWLRPEMISALLIIPVLYYLFAGFALTELIQASYANWLRDLYLERSEQE